ncbi:MAG: LPS export ABC transporter periplasmic protein LptC [Treponema sp.]|uniref:LPS export ABC transporter periplasmic protein LptC n=1 Tax=Treponema sp. TaxID=166 RepID=UPI00298EAC88|nr:LPS export ABC transporter periplasmic protein LptC [Treponema sp.]MCQ2600494.1 LPS export ABC transporter periplasmic protein LptC [Treponema sp.]
MRFENRKLCFMLYFLFIFSLSACSLKYQRETVSEETVPQISFEELVLTQYADDKKTLRLEGAVYEQYKKSGFIYAKDASFVIFDSDQAETSSATAKYISADTRNKIYEFFDGIQFLDNNQGTQIAGNTLKWNTSTEQLVSAKNQELTIKKDNLEITGKDFSASAISNTFLFSGPVHGQQILTGANAGDTITFSGDSMQGSMASSKNSSKKNYTILSGNATVKTSTMEIQADTIELSGEDFNHIKASGNIKGTNTESELSFTAQEMEYNQDTKVVILTGDVELKDEKNNVTAKAQSIEYDQNTDVAVMQIDVELTQKQNVCKAAYSIYRKKEQTLELSGNATVRQKDDMFRAQSIKFNMETEEIQMDGNIRGTVTSN